jgi:three-Cys-motif partner protein
MPQIPTIWPLDPHTQAKHRILEEYLKAWFPILSRYHNRIIFIDGFAGPGIYEKGEFGSPIIVLRCLLEHSLHLCEERSATEFAFLFIEENAERASILEQKIADLYPNLPKNIKINVYHGNFETAMDTLLTTLEDTGKNIAPTFAFIDPFGYNGLPFQLIRRILAFPRCEVFINFAYNGINRFIETYDSREEIFDGLFGTTEWRKTRGISNSDVRNSQLTSLYTQQLTATARYVRSFEMINNLNQVSYYLYFATNNRLGFEEMKKAMWRVDPRGSFRFADTTDVNQRYLMAYDEDSKFKEQAEVIFNSFSGRTVTAKTIVDYCIDSTGYPQLWKKSLKILEESGKITVANRERRGTYPDNSRITFSK